MLGDTLGFIFSADHEAADILEEEQGNTPLLRQFDEMRALDRAFAEQHAIVGKDRDRNAPNMRETADERRPIGRLELVILAAIDDARDNLVPVIGRTDVLREYAGKLFGLIVRRPPVLTRTLEPPLDAAVRHALSHHLQ